MTRTDVSDVPNIAHGPSGSQTYRGAAQVSVSWDAGPDRRSVRCVVISQSPNGERTVELDEAQPSGWFEIGEEPNAIEGELTLSFGGGLAILAGDFATGPSTAFQGQIATWTTSSERAFDPVGSGVAIRSLRPCGDLFGFLWVRAPSASEDDTSRFLRWSEPLAFPSGGDDVLAGARAFVASPDYFGDPAAVKKAAGKLLEIADAVFDAEPEDVASTIEGLLDVPPARYLRSTESRALETRLWHSFVADALLGPKDPDATQVVLRALRARALLANLADGDTETAPVASAIPVLPRAFALRPEAPPPPSKEGWVQILGMGVLEVVEQKLLGYELGDIANTINVMPFESRVDRRSESTTIDVTEREEQREDRADAEIHVVEGEADLDDEVQDVIGGKSICRDYTNITPKTGPAGFCVSLTGKWNGSDCLKERSRRQAAAFAQRITDQAAKRLKARSVVKRSRHLQQSSVREQTSRIDNRGRDQRNVGVFRWLEKIYTLSLHDRGLRILAELMLDSPSKRFVEDVAASGPRPLVAPVAPSALTPPIDGPSAIAANNYRSLATRYGAVDVPPPPKKSVTVSSRFESDGPARAGQVEVPAGHTAKLGTVTYALVDGSFPLVGFVGAQPLELKSSGAVARAPDAADGDSGCTCPDPFEPPTPATPAVGTSKVATLSPATGSIPVAFRSGSPSFTVTVDVECNLDDHADLLLAWQEDVYARILAAYETQQTRYTDALHDRIEAKSEDDRGRTIERALTTLGMDVLGAKAKDGATPELYRFFDAAFEWPAMAFDFKSWPAGDAPTTSPCCFAGESNVDRDARGTFDAFLRAKSARVLLPIRRGFELSVLYFLASGKQWVPCPPDIPLDASAVSAVAELLASEASERSGSGPSWRVSVPTTLTMLQDAEEIPGDAP